MRQYNINHTMMTIASIFLLLLAIGCTSEDAAGEGSLRLQAGGGKALETGFPYTEGGVEYAFLDGWSLQFTRVCACLRWVVQRGNGVKTPMKGPIRPSLCTVGNSERHHTLMTANLTQICNSISFSSFS